jgi:hypothetical protein
MPENIKKIEANAFSPDLIAIGLAVLFGLLISTLPHIIWFIKTGDPAWIADSDDILYLSYSANSYYNDSLNLGDPVLISGGVTKYPWIQFIPPVLLAKLLGIAPVHINIIWRIWAGITMPLGFYAVTRLYTKNTWVALCASIFLMTDIGVFSATLGYKHFITASQIATDNAKEIFQTYPKLMTQWRIISPGISVPFLLLHIYLLQRANLKPSRDRIFWAALGLGSLFYIFFYFWTAALLALAIAIILDTANRKTYFLVGIFGTLIGIPQIIQQALIKNTTNSDWLPRSNKFLSIPHFSQLLIPFVAILLLSTSIIWILRKRKDLIYLWSLGLAGLVLANHQIITGLEIENFHWMYCWGPVISMLTIIIAVDLLSLLHSWQRGLKLCGIALSVIYLSTGLWLRSLEATRTKQSVTITTDYHKYNQQAEKSVVKFVPRGVVAGAEEFVNFAIISDNQRPLNHYTVELSSSVDNNEWDRRVTLNAFMMGKERSIFIDKEKAGLLNTTWGPWASDAQKLAERITNRQNYFDRISLNLSPALEEFEVRYLALSVDADAPKYLDKNWRLLQDGENWKIWEKL